MFITRVMETVGVISWADLKGKHVRALQDSGKVHKIRHILEDELEFDPQELKVQGGLDVPTPGRDPSEPEGKRTVTRRQLAAWSTTNSSKLPKIVVDAGLRYRWVGIGW